MLEVRIFLGAELRLINMSPHICEFSSERLSAAFFLIINMAMILAC
ncbi:hypothetical protein HCH_00353 [Hahella chejuensis KCTC 2396]|uniref:Uncharacterized protein n=1 Tax=Hahella chejuensis (strain KCTC 2396) TaxID=349521 RepID=Q2SQ09_HAHCH|nr:hypothetical protein HCH_00353 [Hahella chejuensis KCTC 2396]